MRTYTDRAFRQSAIALGGFVLMIFLAIGSVGRAYPNILGLLAFFSGFFAIFGSVNSIRSLSEPNTAPKVLAMVVNFAIAIMFALMMIANVVDIIKVFA